MNILHSTLDRVRDTWTAPPSTSTFRKNGEITPQDFLRAGDYLVYKFPSWQWADAEPPSKRVAYLPAGKQFLVTRGVPCRRRLEEYNEAMGGEGERDVEGDWLSTGGGKREEGDGGKEKEKVKTLDESGKLGSVDGAESDDEFPDMEDEEDDEDAIIRDNKSDENTPLRTYTLYITYTPYYRTPRIYLSGYSASGTPLEPTLMMDDIVGDYKDKTVTLEDFPFFSNNIKMASVHPCKHSSVMKTLLDRADGALKIRREKMKKGRAVEGLTEDMKKLEVERKKEGEDEWEVVQDDGDEEEAIRVDQYLVVFLKFISSVTPTIEHDFTMGI